MADFSIAFAKMIANEGGYVLTNKKNDNGKETFAGISRKFHPTWIGWKIVDRLKKTPNQRYTDPELRKRVYVFYRSEFWNQVQGKYINDQLMAESIFDFAVNTGVETSTRLAQIAVGASPDGRIGRNTLAKLNKTTYDDFVFRYTVSKVARYAGICNRDPNQIDHLLGWINRTLNTAKGVV